MDKTGISLNDNSQLNQDKSNNKFKNLISDFFLIKLFDHLHKTKVLEILRYNNHLQKRLNLSMKDYKDYYETIEIDITPQIGIYGKFINIKKGDESYYHIYFNDNTEDIKRNNINKEDKVKKIKIIIYNKVKSFSQLFSSCECIKTINFTKFYRGNIYNMSFIFYECSSLEEIKLTSFNSSNVKDMSGMFSKCSSLKEINLSNLKTNNVISMYGMFYGCSKLDELDLSNFDTSKVQDMGGMFYGCASLKKINFSSFDTSNVTSMKNMFSWCIPLKDIDLSKFNTAKVTNMFAMFSYCLSLKDIDLSNFNIDKVTDMKSMFFAFSDEMKMKIKSQIKNIKEEAFN